MNKERVAVIGSGISGLCAAWHLQRSGKFDVTLLEAEGRAGGNAWTVDVDGVGVDVGFLVYNNATYANMIGLFEELGVETVESDMSFGFSLQDVNSTVEWASHNISALFAQKSNLFRLGFYAMIKDMIRFNNEMPVFLRKYEELDVPGPTVGEFLSERNYSQSFTDHYLLPMLAAVWSATMHDALTAPARFIFRFFVNHRLAQVFDRPRWRTVKGGSKNYVQKVCCDIEKRGGKVRCNARVVEVVRNEHEALVQIDGANTAERFDAVVFATHAPTTVTILGDGIETEEGEILSKFKYSTADCILHKDASWMPKRREAWSSWNFVQKKLETDANAPVCVTYFLNRLQANNFRDIDMPELFETLNPSEPIPEHLVLKRMRMSHPQFTFETAVAQKNLSSIQGNKRTYFCGSWTRFGFHEDGALSGFEVAEMLSGVNRLWHGKQEMLELIEVRGVEQNRSLMSFISESFSRPIVEKFMDLSIRQGSLNVVDSNGSARIFGEPSAVAKMASRPVTDMYILSSQFYPRVASVADIGFAEAYMLRWVEFESFQQLLDFFNILILNRDRGNLDNSKLGTSYIGTLMNNLMHKFFRRNTLTGSRKNIAAHYDLSNDLFATFLGKTWTYSCGLWLEKNFSLDDAQVAKLDRIAKLARIDSSCEVLEIGFGWGEFAIHAVKTTGCRITGVTLSEQQLELATKRVKSAGLSNQITLVLCDYREVQGKFDRIVSIEMLEAVGHDFLGNFFDSCERYLKPNGVVVVQVITTPEERYEAYRTSSDFISRYIFPGGCCPSVTALLEAMRKNSTLSLEQMDNFAPHYAKTLAAWRYRFVANEQRVEKLGFDSVFFRMWNYYFTYCEAGFATRTLGLMQMVFSRAGNTKVLGGVP